MTRPRRNLRLFVAVYPPPELAEALVAAAEDEVRRILAGPRSEHEAFGIKRVPPEQVHLTLQFVGDVPVRDLERVRESVGRAAGGLEACMIQPTRFIALPREGAARLVAIECDAPPTVFELKRRLAARLARKPRSASDDRFLPHLTVCRFRTPIPFDADEIAPGATDAFAAFPCREIRLMRSVLDPSGAQHREVEAYPLVAGRD